MTLKERREFRVPFKLQMKRVAVSLEDADGFIRALRASLGSERKGEPDAQGEPALKDEAEAGEKLEDEAESESWEDR